MLTGHSEPPVPGMVFYEPGSCGDGSPGSPGPTTTHSPRGTDPGPVASTTSSLPGTSGIGTRCALGVRPTGAPHAVRPLRIVADLAIDDRHSAIILFHRRDRPNVLVTFGLWDVQGPWSTSDSVFGQRENAFLPWIDYSSVCSGADRDEWYPAKLYRPPGAEGSCYWARGRQEKDVTDS